MTVFSGPLGEARIRQAGAGWYADLLHRSAVDGVVGAHRLVATGVVPDMHHMTLRHTFPAGAVPPGWHAEPRVAVDLPVLDYDMEAISTHADGSVKEAAFTLLLPAMGEGDEVILEFRPRNRPAPADPVEVWQDYDRAARPPVQASPILGYTLPDHTAKVAAGGAPGEWRKVSRNRYRDIVHPLEGGHDPYYWYPGKTDHGLQGTNGLPFAYSSGAFMPERRKYVFTGGGHADWLGSEVGVFDYRTGRWHRTEDSARYVVGDTGNQGEPQEHLFDPTAPVKARPHGSRYHYPWPTIRGRHAPLSTHTYCGVSHVPERGRVYVFGAAGYPGGSAKPGGIWVIDDTDFRWLGEETIPTRANGYNSWTQALGDGRLFCFAGQSGVGRIFDLASRKELWKFGGDRARHRATYGTPSAALIDGPGGGKSFVTFAAGHKKDALVASWRVDDGSANMGFQPIDGGVPLPEGVNQRASWLYLGDYLPGSRAIAVYQPGGGLYALDTDRWTWRGPFQAEAGEAPPNKRAWKGFGYLPAYDCFSVVHDEGVWICKRPPEMA